MNFSQPRGRPGQPGPSFTNQAYGYAHVGVQAGVVNGDVHLYDVRGDLPKEKYRVALNCLDGNMPRRAEELINEAVAAGFVCDLEARFTANHVAYHWALAVLSGRSFDHLGPQDFASLQRAAKAAQPDQADEWTTALDVVTRLINCLLRQEQAGSTDLAEFGGALSAFEALPRVRRDEIRRHLDMILVGGIQDQLDAIYAEEVRAQRTGRGRDKRVWKFFQPVPERPRARMPEAPVLEGSKRAMAVCGGVACGAGLLLCLGVIVGHSATAAVVVVALFAGGGYAVWRFGISRFAATGRLADAERAHGVYGPVTRYGFGPPKLAGYKTAGADEEEDTEDVKQAKARQWEFRRLLAAYVEYRFYKEAPDGSKAQQRWAMDTAGLKATLTNELIGLYDEPPAEPGAVNWLVKWQVSQIARRWRAGELYGYREELRTPAATAIGLAAGATGLCIGAFIALAEMFRAQAAADALLSAALAGFGCWLLVKSRADVYLAQRHRLPADRAEVQQRLHAEKQEYEKWEQILSDRPSDAEMARWLDYDKMYVKTLAMNQHGLTNRDIIAHAVLTEAGYWRRRARILNGPWRYSSYIISLFLLTEAGVRQVTHDLAFATGVVSNQRRTNFRYDAIAAARVAELGIRFDRGHRQVILLDDNNRNRDNEIQSLILSHGFQLSLVSGQAITVVVENFDDGLLDRMREDPRRLFELALDTSGVAGALRILEAVAAEGREWITQERERRGRRVVEFQKSLGVPDMLTQARSAVSRQITSGDNGHQPGRGTGPGTQIA